MFYMYVFMCFLFGVIIYLLFIYILIKPSRQTDDMIGYYTLLPQSVKVPCIYRPNGYKETENTEVCTYHACFCL